MIGMCKSIATDLLPEYVSITNGEKLNEIVEGFETYLGFPQAAGAIDGSHIPKYVLMRVHHIIVGSSSIS